MLVKRLAHDDEKCTKCHLCEKACSQAFFKDDALEKSRISIEENSINVCNQCGECIDVCNEMALYRNSSGVVMLDSKKCVGCLMCVGFCPSLSLRLPEGFLKPFKCTACGICVKECPEKVLTIECNN